MDPITQVLLGAAIGTVTIGRKVGARKGALIGGVIAELPDLDVFLPTETRLDGFIDHRGPTHSIVMQALITPVFGEALRFVDRRLRDERWLCYGLVFAAFSTHALIDGFTTYGTKLLWPIFTEPISWSSIFIIDPLYTLPLLLAFLVSMFARAPNYVEPLGARARRAASAALILSTAYLGWTMMARELAETKVLDALAADEMRYERLTLTPMPFNSLLWRGLAIDGESYANVYVSLLDGDAPAPVHRHERNVALAAQLPDRTSLDKIAWFSRGFYTVFEADGAVFARDLRMGVEPDYFFTFEIARRNSETLRAVAPVQRAPPRDWSGLDWVWRRIFDPTAVRDE
jgi:inner membrane protein